jgi:hypothetical protein
MGSLTAAPALAEAGNPVRPKPLYSRLGFSAWRSGGRLEFHVDNRRLSGEAGIAEVLQRKPAFLMLLNAAVLLLLTLSSMAYALPAFNVVQYGAAGDGHTLDSPAIQRAIDAASVHGGTVIVPAWGTRPIPFGPVATQTKVEPIHRQGCLVGARDMLSAHYALALPARFRASAPWRCLRPKRHPSYTRPA